MHTSLASGKINKKNEWPKKLKEKVRLSEAWTVDLVHFEYISEFNMCI